MTPAERIRATLQRLAAGIDRLDAAVWEAERRQNSLKRARFSGR